MLDVEGHFFSPTVSNIQVLSSDGDASYRASPSNKATQTDRIASNFASRALIALFSLCSAFRDLRISHSFRFDKEFNLGSVAFVERRGSARVAALGPPGVFVAYPCSHAYAGWSWG